MRPRRRPVNKQGDRNLTCIHYNTCLDHAVKKGWQHWNCGTCSYKSEKETFDPVQTVRDSVVQYELPSSLSRQFFQR